MGDNRGVLPDLSKIGSLSLPDGWSRVSLRSVKHADLKLQLQEYQKKTYGSRNMLVERLKLTLDEHFILQVQAECNRTLHLYSDADWERNIWTSVSRMFGITEDIAREILINSQSPVLSKYADVLESLNGRLLTGGYQAIRREPELPQEPLYCEDWEQLLASEHDLQASDFL